MKLRIALCQISSGDSVSENMEKIDEAVRKNRSDIYLFPELFLTRYGTSSFDRHLIDEAISVLKTTCMKMDIAIVIGLPFETETGWTNSLAFITADDVSRYDKLYLANFPPYKEDIFQAGTKPTLVDWKGFRFGLLICYDAMFPEIHRYYAVNGADVVLMASASAEKSKAAMQTVLPARSLENTVYTAFCNNIIDGPAGRFFGCSAVYSPLGTVIRIAGAREEIVVTDIDSDEIRKARDIRHHLKDLRNDIEWP